LVIIKKDINTVIKVGDINIEASIKFLGLLKKNVHFATSFCDLWLKSIMTHTFIPTLILSYKVYAESAK
jgi:hypothetical protein